MLLSSEGYGKPYTTEQLLSKRDQSIAKVDFWRNGDVHETSVLRGKRDASNAKEYLRNYCSKPTQLSQSTMKCVAGSYVCHGYNEIVCSKTSFACLSSVSKFGYPNCTVSKFEWVTINLGSGGEKQVRRTSNCSCA